MAEYITRYGQTIIDVSLNTYGNVENAIKLYIENESTIGSINGFIFQGEKVNFDKTFENRNDFILQTLKDSLIEISTGSLNENRSRGFDIGFDRGFK